MFTDSPHPLFFLQIGGARQPHVSQLLYYIELDVEISAGYANRVRPATTLDYCYNRELYASNDYGMEGLKSVDAYRSSNKY